MGQPFFKPTIPNDAYVFQTPLKYEQALARHAQSLRWMRSIQCTCLDPQTNQADPQHDLCKGRGVYYQAPDSFIYQERAVSDSSGVIWLSFPTSVTSIQVQNTRNSQFLTVSTVVGRKAYLSVPVAQFGLTPLLVKYRASFKQEVIAALCTVVDVGSSDFVYLRPRLVTNQTFAPLEATVVLATVKDEELNDIEVLEIDRDLIKVAKTDAISYRADCIFVPPFKFLLHSVSEKMKWETGYVAEGADAQLVVPYYVKLGVHDIVTMLSGRQQATEILEVVLNRLTDIIRNYYDVAEIADAYASDGTRLDTTKVSVVNRNELLWADGFRPVGRYTVQFYYRPTFAILPSLPTLRAAEDAAFVNRVSVVEYTRMTGQNTF